MAKYQPKYFKSLVMILCKKFDPFSAKDLFKNVRQDKIWNNKDYYEYT